MSSKAKQNKTSLFDENQQYTGVGKELAEMTRKALAPIFKDFRHFDYATQDISKIMQEVIEDLEKAELSKESEVKA